MDRLAIIQEQQIVQPTVRFSVSRKDLNYGQIRYNPRAKNN